MLSTAVRICAFTVDVFPHSKVSRDVMALSPSADKPLQPRLRFNLPPTILRLIPRYQRIVSSGDPYRLLWRPSQRLLLTTPGTTTADPANATMSLVRHLLTISICRPVADVVDHYRDHSRDDLAGVYPETTPLPSTIHRQIVATRDRAFLLTTHQFLARYHNALGIVTHKADI